MENTNKSNPVKHSSVGSSNDEYLASHNPSLTRSQSHQKKKRVGKACEFCRIRKIKCDGRNPCSKCIQVNKICVFKDKKKTKDKNYPDGYVELLEARLDLLSKAFETIIQLSRPHLPFLNELLANDLTERASFHDCSDNDNNSPDESPSLDESSIPINKVICYLIDHDGLLRKLPIEWEAGAYLAANYTNSQYEMASKKFADHKSMEGSNKALEAPMMTLESRNRSGSGPDPISASGSGLIPEVGIKDDFQLDGLDTNNMGLFNDDIGLPGFPVDDYSVGLNSSALTGLIPTTSTDSQSESNFIDSRPSLFNETNISISNNERTNSPSFAGVTIPEQSISPMFERSGDFRPATSYSSEPSLDFFHEGESSVSSLTNRLKNHQLNTSPSTTPSAPAYGSQSSKAIFSPQLVDEELRNLSLNVTIADQSSQLSRTSIGRPRSPSQHRKNIGYVHKPVHSGASHSHGHNHAHSHGHTHAHKQGHHQRSPSITGSNTNPLPPTQPLPQTTVHKSSPNSIEFSQDQDHTSGDELDFGFGFKN